MNDSLRPNSPPGLPPKRKRYWSVMLVGEHGRVVPLRHFNWLAVTILLMLALSLVGMAALGVGYWHSRQIIDRMRAERDDLRHHVAQLRDEKDVLLAKRVIETIQAEAADPLQGPGANSHEEVRPSTTEGRVSPEMGSDAHAESQAKDKSAATEVRWQADIRHFEATYKPGQEEIQISFQIHNATAPRQALAGAIVVVFEHTADPTVDCLPVPAVALHDGIPSSDGGQAFRINNYRTMRFRATGQKIPIPYNQVSIFVFEQAGTLLLTRQFDIDMPGPPEAKTRPMPPALAQHVAEADGSSNVRHPIGHGSEIIGASVNPSGSAVVRHGLTAGDFPAQMDSPG